MSSIFVNKLEFENYKGCSHPTALKKYDLYLDLVNKTKEQELTIYDLSRVDDLPLDIVKQRCGKV
jgi:hypothetical protein